MESNSTSIELKVISCRDLKAFNFFQKLSVYVVVSLVKVGGKNNSKNEEKEKQQQRQKTPIDREGEGNPRWNHVMRFDLKGEGALHLDDYWDDVFIQFDLLCEAIVFGFGDKTIGQVRVPIKDLMTGEEEWEERRPSKAETVRFVSYQVRSPEGKPNGVLHFSYKIIRNNVAGPGSGRADVDDHHKISIGDAYHPHPSVEVQVQVQVEVGSQLHYPSVQVEPPPSMYPRIEFEPLPPLPLSFSPPHPTLTPSHEASYWAPESYYTVPPTPAHPPPGTCLPYHYYHYYPPPPPAPYPPQPPLPPPPTQPLFYHAPPDPYGYVSGSNGWP